MSNADWPRLRFALLLIVGGLFVLSVSVITALLGGIVLGGFLHPALSPGVPGTNVQGGELAACGESRCLRPENMEKFL
jgi:hypothetical protein